MRRSYSGRVKPAVPAFCFFLICVFLLAAGSTAHSDSAGKNPQVRKITVLRESGGRLDWCAANNRIVFDRIGADGYYDLYTMNPDGTGEQSLTSGKSALPGKHIGNPAWHPSGKYIVFQAQKKFDVRELRNRNRKPGQNRTGNRQGRTPGTNPAAPASPTATAQPVPESDNPLDDLLNLPDSDSPGGQGGPGDRGTYPRQNRNGGKAALQERMEKLNKLIDYYSSPGSGLTNDLWITDTAGTTFWRMTDVSVPVGGVLHPQFSHGGDKLLWAERVGKQTKTPGERYGKWVIKLADFKVKNGVPVLENIRTLTPGTRKMFYETHGFSPDDSKIIFCANAEPGQDERYIDIYALHLASTKLTRLTDTLDQWDEHAHYSPDGRRIVWMSSTGTGTANRKVILCDYWLMNADGSGKERLTYFNDPGSPEHMGKGEFGGVICADSAWSPDGKRIAAYVIASTKRTGKIVMIELK